MKTKKEKIYQPHNLSALARYLDTTSQNIHWYKREKPKKFELLQLGWEEVCRRELHT